MQLRYKSATATVTMLSVWETSYTGALSRDACLALGRYVRGVTASDPMVERIDKALIAVAGVPFEQSEVAYMQGTQPGAIVCRPDQYVQMANFCMFLGNFGVKRIAFLDSQLEQAREWCAQFAPVRSQLVWAAQR